MSNSQNPMIQNDSIEKYFFILLRFDSSSKESAGERRIATYYLPPEFTLKDQGGISELNQKLNEPENHYPYKATGSTQTAINRYKEGYPINKDNFVRTNNILNEAIESTLSISSENIPDAYPQALLDTEKVILFTRKGGFQWISFPVISRGLCFAILIAQVKGNCDILSFLNKSAYTLSDNLLQNLAKYNISHPFNDITQLDDINLICSLVASQVGLESTEFKGNDITFLRNDSKQGSKQEVLQLEKPYEYHRIIFKCNEEEKAKINQFLYTHKIRINRYCHRIQALTKTARAAIMARNFSHNVGSHALANPHLFESLGLRVEKKEEAEEVERRLGTFNAYMQGRLDFMARAMSKSSHRPEPLFLLQDVMEGFFKQGVLLDNLIEDASYSGKNIEFHINIQGNKVKYTWCKEEKSKPTDGSEYFGFHTDDDKLDVIVGIPGGMVGAHALYAFLENILRNSTKYGKKGSQEAKLIIHLNLEKCEGKRSQKDKEPGWILSIWDNISTDAEHSASTKIREFINQSLINDDGSMNHKGHGIQEMKLCAELLSGGLRFPPDGNGSYNNNPLRCIPCTEIGLCKSTEAYEKSHQHHLAKIKDQHPIGEPQALRCYGHEKEWKEENVQKKGVQLVYDLLLPIPVLLGVVRLGADNGSPENPPSNIKYYNAQNTLKRRMEELAEKGAHIAVLLDDGTVDIDCVLKCVASLHPFLPFRLMVVTGENGRKTKWEVQLKMKYPNKSFEFETHISKNRLRVCEDNDLRTLLSNGPGEDTKFVGTTGWNAVMLHAYDAWMREYKPEATKQKKKWHLCIGFQRNQDTVKKNWGMSDGEDKKEVFNATGESYIRMDVSTCDDKNSSLIKIEDCSTALVFDNHGKVFNLDAEPCFKQDFGSKESLSLYQSLESPPQGAFGFAFFVYSLVEAALTKVAVLDERVAHTLLESSDGRWDFKDETFLSQFNAKIYPLLHVTKESEVASVSDKVDSFTAYAKSDTGVVGEIGKQLKSEGLLLGEESKISVLHYKKYNGTYAPTDTPLDMIVDILVIHEGVMDRLEDRGIWKQGFSMGLFAAAPFVVRTSGRGNKSRQLDDRMPFIEFNEISGNIYQEFNKYALVQGLLGSSAELKETQGD